jgi:hypothetical protein
MIVFNDSYRANLWLVEWTGSESRGIGDFEFSTHVLLMSYLLFDYLLCLLVIQPEHLLQ